MSIHKYKLQDKNDYPVRNPTCGIYVLQSLQLHSPPFQQLIRSLKIGRVFDCFISCGNSCQSATNIGYGLNPKGRGSHLWNLSIIAVS